MRGFQWAVCCIVAFLVSCSFATASPEPVVSVPERAAHAEPASGEAPPAAADAPPAQARFVLGSAASWSGLTVWPVIDREAQPSPAGDFSTLAEALADGSLTIAEVDSGGSVPTLQVHNTGAKTVLLTAGEVVQGGKQDRVLVQDVLVAPSDAPQDIAVNCVERGRWSQGQTGLGFRYGGKSEVALTRTVQKAKSQTSTWSKVAELNAEKRQAVSPSDQSQLTPASGTYMASLGSEQVQSRVAAGVAQLQPAFAGVDKAVGMVIAVDGKVASAELYGHPRLFEGSRDQALRGAALQAVATEGEARVQVVVADSIAQAFLDQALTAEIQTEEAEQDGSVVRQELKARASSTYRTAGPKGELLHLNAYAE